MSLYDSKLLGELKAELFVLDNLRADFIVKENYTIAEAYLNTINHIKRAISRAFYPDKIAFVNNWMGVLMEAHSSDKTKTTEAISAQLVYDLFNETEQKTTILTSNTILDNPVTDRIEMIEYDGSMVPQDLCTVDMEGFADDFIGCGNCMDASDDSAIECKDCLVDKLFRAYARLTNQDTIEKEV